MKTLAAILSFVAISQLQVGALLIDFNDLALGSNPNGTYYDQVRLTTAGQTYDRETGLPMPTTTGTVSDLYGDSPNALVYLPTNYRNLVAIAADFLVPVARFSLDINSNYSMRLSYTGIDAFGSPLSGVVSIFNTHNFDLNPFELIAPLGSYLTGFSVSQGDNGSVELAIDNLDFTAATAQAGVQVPEGGATIFMLVGGMAALVSVRRRMPIIIS